MNISEIKAEANCYTPDEVELLKVEVRLFLNKMEASQAEVLAKRSNLLFQPAALEFFFRGKDRNDKTQQILQYMLAFMEQIPETVIYENKMLNPIETFRECVLSQVNLLLEEDVKKAVFNQINQLGSLDGDNVWDYQERIIKKNRELQELMARATDEDAQVLFTMSLVLEQICLFWFDVNHSDLLHIRRSDILLYKLAKVLQDRYLQEKKKTQP
jgi:hypothetical protein